MDSNNLYQNQQTGTEPDNNQTENAYQSNDTNQTENTYQSGDAYQTGNSYQSGDAYQTGNSYQSGDAYQTGNFYQSGDAYQTGNPYQSGDAYQNDNIYQQPVNNQGGSYNNNNYANSSYDSGNYTNSNPANSNYNGGNNYNNGNYSNGNYNNNYGGGYGNNIYQPYQPSQLDLEEPVKMSEWLISLLLMMVPCVNIVMMFVWAFSKTEKKSKSNFFKAQLIMVGVIFAMYMVIIIFAVAAGLMY
ncbi:MAG: hypothetical protein K2H40_13380 [Lachnospiraceae bacterium]|nr:hypothetical protein [Lachnospiraceae bacterium]